MPDINIDQSLCHHQVDAVVIGCSAGGLSALRILLQGLPAGLNATIIIVAHTAPEGPSLLPPLLAIDCLLPVSEAVEREQAKPGHVYVAPPNYHLLIEQDHTFSVSVDDRVCFVRPSIDVLFYAAADVYQERLLGIILTGANSDGALGLNAIKNAGGITLVQEPATAYADTMPLAAIAIGATDKVLPLEDIAGALLRHCSINRVQQC
jgi:two-component system chemotaxis response regulator CheB